MAAHYIKGLVFFFVGAVFIKTFLGTWTNFKSTATTLLTFFLYATLAWLTVWLFIPI